MWGPGAPVAPGVTPARAPSFGALIAELSEAASGPHADNLISNEDSYPRVAGALARQAPRNGVYLGVGPDQNFTYLARTSPSLAFILDYRRRNLLLHLVHKALFALAPDRVAYLSRLTARRPGRLPPEPMAEALVAAFEHAAYDRGQLERTVAEVAAYLRPLGVVEADEWPELALIQAKLAGPGMNARFLALPMYPTFGRLIRTNDHDGAPAHLLAREEYYQDVRALQRGDRVIPLVGDFAGPTTPGRLDAWLRRQGRALAVLYISDVEFFLLRAGRFPAYVENLARLPWAEGALIVRTSTREIAHPERVKGDSSTTIARAIAPFLAAARAGKIRRVEDLFDP
jgi:hypothetical protein